jgi:hypothetical protein
LPEVLLGDRYDGNKLQVGTRRKLFNPRFKYALAQISTIQAVLGSPPELVITEWLKLPNRQYML